MLSDSLKIRLKLRESNLVVYLKFIQEQED